MFRIKNPQAECPVSLQATSIRHRRSRTLKLWTTWRSISRGRTKTIRGTCRSTQSPAQAHIMSTLQASHTVQRATPAKRRVNIHSNVDLNLATASPSSRIPTPTTALSRKSKKVTFITTRRTTPWSPSGSIIHDMATNQASAQSRSPMETH